MRSPRGFVLKNRCVPVKEDFALVLYTHSMSEVSGSRSALGSPKGPIEQGKRRAGDDSIVVDLTFLRVCLTEHWIILHKPVM